MTFPLQLSTEDRRVLETTSCGKCLSVAGELCRFRSGIEIKTYVHDARRQAARGEAR